MSSKVLVIGSGSREHALAWKLSQSTKVLNIYVCPGNGGTKNETKTTNIDLPISNFNMIIDWCKYVAIDLVVVGPEDPLADGISDAINAEGILCFGPSRNASQIEASKYFSKSFMDRHGIPTARWSSFTRADSAINFLDKSDFNGFVVKASGLAAGKGVIVTTNKNEAIVAVQEMMEMKKFGAAGSTIIIEEKLEGEEISLMALSDGDQYLTLPSAQDHKRAYDDDKGPNTGGMGAYAPVPHITRDALEYIEQQVIKKTVDGMKKEGYPFIGTLYAGLMITNSGPKVLEFNCRFGDPETQVVLPLINVDFFDLLVDCCNRNLKQYSFNCFNAGKSAVTITMASGGYPGNYRKDIPINGVNEANNLTDIQIFHAGTKMDGSQLKTNGGRVLSLTAISNSVQNARLKAYEALGLVTFYSMMYRNDIAKKFLCYQIVHEVNQKSYADAGVSIEAGATFVESIGGIAKNTHRSGCMSDIGSFGSLFDLKQAGYDDPILVSGTDGVGTKLKIADKCNIHSTVGVDLVAMCVNDILAHGAEPLFFLDYFASGKLDLDIGKNVVKGIAEGCKQAGCALIGGETAEMPGMYQNKDYDLAGFAVGAVNKNNVLPKMSSIQKGDIVVGLESSGIHSNGFSLVRKIINDIGYNYADECPFMIDKTLGECLLTPTRIYVKSVLPLMKQGYVKAFAHITGGGLLENIPRVLPPNIACVLDAHSWNIPPVFGWLAQEGNVTADEMMKVYNCGVGGVLVIDRKHSDLVLKHLKSSGENANVIGILEDKKEDGHQVEAKEFSAVLEVVKSNFHVPNKKTKKDQMKVGVLISGSGTNLQSLIDHCSKKNSSAEIVLVISNVENAYGLQRAVKANIKTKVINHKKFKKRLDFDMAVLNELKGHDVELVCLAGFMRILTGEFVRNWPSRLINIHPSLLPSFKGPDAHDQALKAGVTITGCTAHFVVEEIDAGAIIYQEAVPVYPHDNHDTLQERVKRKEWEIFPKALELVASRKIKLVDGKLVHFNLN